MIYYKNCLNFLLILSFIFYSNGCPPGTSPFLKKCVKCQEGTYSPIGTFCYDCPRGFYSSQIGADICNLCPPGSYNPFLGSTTCEKCRPGTYSREYGSEICEKCPNDEYSDDGATSCYKINFFDRITEYLYKIIAMTIISIIKKFKYI